MSSVPHLRAGRGGSMKSQGGYQLLKPGRSWQGAGRGGHTTAEEAAALWPGRWTGLGGEAMSPSPLPLLQNTGNFRWRSQSQEELGDIRGGRPPCEIKESRLPPFSEPSAGRVAEERRRGGSQFSQRFRGREAGESPPGPQETGADIGTSPLLVKLFFIFSLCL